MYGYSNKKNVKQYNIILWYVISVLDKKKGRFHCKQRCVPHNFGLTFNKFILCIKMSSQGQIEQLTCEIILKINYKLK